MVKRRSLTPGGGAAKGDVHATRRGSGGARKEVTDRVILRRGNAEFSGWALNESRGGIRIILEDRVELGHEYEVEMGQDDGSKKRRGRVVWVQEENDGMVVGLEFVSDRPPSTAPRSDGPTATGPASDAAPAASPPSDRPASDMASSGSAPAANAPAADPFHGPGGRAPKGV